MNIITNELRLSEVKLPTKWVDRLKDDIDRDSTLIRKGLTPDDFNFIPNERAAIFVVTTADLDRDGEIIVPSGVSFKSYERTGKPVLWAHMYSMLGIGRCQWIRYDKGTNKVIAKVEFAKHDFANTIYEHIKEFPLSCSIGFIPNKIALPDEFGNIDWEKLGVEKRELSNASRVYLSCEMLELSLCPVPANPNSYQLAVSKGLISPECIKSLGYAYDFSDKSMEEVQEDVEGTSKEEIKETRREEKTEKEIITKPETTERYHHIPVSAGHDDHVIRTISISDDEGIKALYCVDCKKIKTYLFDVEKWIMEDAHKWVEEHSKSCLESLKADIIQIDKICYKLGIDEDDIIDLLEKAVGSRSLPISDRYEWDGDEAKYRMAVWAGGPDKEKINWNKYARGFAYSAPNASNFKDFKLPFADIIDGKLTAVWGGVSAAMKAVLGSRGGVDLAEADRKSAYDLLKSYYLKFNKEVPDYKSYSHCLIEETLSILSNLDGVHEDTVPTLKRIKAKIEDLVGPDSPVVAEDTTSSDTIYDIVKQFSDMLSSKLDLINVDVLVDESLKRARGKMF